MFNRCMFFMTCVSMQGSRQRWAFNLLSIFLKFQKKHRSKTFIANLNIAMLLETHFVDVVQCSVFSDATISSKDYIRNNREHNKVNFVMCVAQPFHALSNTSFLSMTCAGWWTLFCVVLHRHKIRHGGAEAEVVLPFCSVQKQDTHLPQASSWIEGHQTDTATS